MITAAEAQQITQACTSGVSEELERISDNIKIHAQQGRNEFFYRGIGEGRASAIQGVFYTSKDKWGPEEWAIQSIIDELRHNGFTVEEYQIDGSIASALSFRISW
jgi:hypothetical protein